MANPRNIVSFNELDQHVSTYTTTGLAQSDLTGLTNFPDVAYAVIKTTANKQVGKGSAAGTLFGGAVKVEKDGNAAVVDRGVCAFTYTSTAPTPGASVASNGDGRVTAATAVPGNIVLDVDTTNLIVWVELQ